MFLAVQVRNRLIGGRRIRAGAVLSCEMILLHPHDSSEKLHFALLGLALGALGALGAHWERTGARSAG
jgi:hypothetical protein